MMAVMVNPTIQTHLCRNGLVWRDDHCALNQVISGCEGHILRVRILLLYLSNIDRKFCWYEVSRPARSILTLTCNDDMTLEQNTFFTHLPRTHIEREKRFHLPTLSASLIVLTIPGSWVCSNTLLHDPTTMPKRNGTPTTSNKNESVHILVLGDGECTEMLEGYYWLKKL